MRLYVDCTRGGNENRRGEYRVTGVPTVLYLDPSGGEIERMEDRSPDVVEAQMRRIAAKHGLAAVVERAFASPPEFEKWVADRLEKLWANDIDVRDQATFEIKKLRDALDAALVLAERGGDAEVRARIKDILGPREPAPIIVKVRSHSIVKEGPLKVEFGCVTKSEINLTVTGGRAAQFVVVDDMGRTAMVEPSEKLKLPEKFGTPSELRIVPASR